MSRAYDDNQTLQQKIIRGANILADNVASTLGPRGRNVLLQEKDKQPFITKDGVTVAHFVALGDPFENAGAQIIKQAAVQTNNDAGDGTTTATVLARSILQESQKFIASGISPIELQRGIDLAVRETSKNLERMAKPITSTEDIEHIATISANNDSTIGRLIALAVDRVGQDGSITIEESRSHDTTLDITEGFKFDSGYCAGAFITDERRAFMHHDDPVFLVTDHKINTVEQILPILEMISRESRPLIIVAEDVDGQALAAMIMNAMRGTLKIAGIKAPAYGEERRAILTDLALSVGATFITRESGQKLADVRMTDLGSAKFVESSKYTTTVVGGNCDFEAVERTIASLKAQIEQTDDLNACERLQDRIVRLSSGVAVIHVGGSTEVEMTERKHRIEDALEAVRSAQEQGIVPGGGTALLRATRSLCVKTDSKEQVLGSSVVVAACQEPIRQMALNAGLSPDLMVNKVLKAAKNNGVDFRTGELINMLEAGIIDPVKVTLTALQNAASCAGTLITTNYGIIQLE
ncbi:molecular chaperone GroEL [Candidatus Pacearchaeota archaeon]|nr:molecular chaperone GroEL [Candidatus Pacearchaeota archaeon]|tara:strand:- start:2295 stop:3866 length:1572 start_codon:yes stop_codon:yes gene_type:complete